MRKLYFLIGLLLILLCCNKAPADIINYEKTWVYVELEVLTEDTDHYYYFGQINQNILDKLSYDQDFNSLFVLTNVRYYDDFDKMQEYADELDNGTLFFRTQDIVKIDVLKKDPLFDTINNFEKDSLNIIR